jgi:hypothetical protein
MPIEALFAPRGGSVEMLMGAGMHSMIVGGERLNRAAPGEIGTGATRSGLREEQWQRQILMIQRSFTAVLGAVPPMHFAAMEDYR